MVDIDSIFRNANDAAVRNPAIGKNLEGDDKIATSAWRAFYQTILDDSDKPLYLLERFRNIYKQKRYESEPGGKGLVDSFTGSIARSAFYHMSSENTI